MKLELFKFIIDEAKRHKIKRLRLYSTAEPLLHPEFDKIIECAKSNGMFVVVSTNAAILHRHIKTLLSVDEIHFSIEGWDQESYERYRYPLSFEKCYQNVVAFDTAIQEKSGTKPFRRINFLLTKETRVPEFMALWGNLVDEIRVAPMHPVCVVENGRVVIKTNPAVESYLFKFNLGEAKKCAYPFGYITIAFDGKIALCCNDFSAGFNLGTIQEGITKAQKSPVLKTIRKEFKSQKVIACRNCVNFLKPDEHSLAEISKLTDAIAKCPPVRAKVVLC